MGRSRVHGVLRLTSPWLVLGFLSALPGCSGSPTGSPLEVFDPAPYSGAVKSDSGTHSPPSFVFSNLQDAHDTMRELASNYEAHRDNLVRDEYIFDIPLVGLAAELAVATANHVASTTVLGMTTASVGVLGARSYLSPATRASAYGGAALALACGADVADQLLTIESRSDYTLIQKQLFDAISTASTPPYTGDEIAAAHKAMNDLSAAFAILQDAPEKLSGFASSVVRGATLKATTGVQDTGALLSQLQALAPATGGKASAPPKSAERGLVHGKIQASAPPPAQTLTDLTASAEALAKAITDAWATTTTCAVKSTS